MKKLVKIFAMCAFVIGGVMITNTGFAQNDAVTTDVETAVESEKETRTASKKACTASKKACCASKGSSAMKTSNAGTAKKCCKAKETSCSGSSAMKTSNAGTAKKCNKPCTKSSSAE